MTQFTLNHEQRYLIEGLIDRTDDPVVLQRAQALLCIDKGERVAEVAKRFQVTRQAVYKWINKFRHTADSKIAVRLQDRPRTGRPAKIKAVVDPIIEEVIRTDPRAFDFDSRQWTVKLLVHYLNVKRGISVSSGSVRLSLSRLGLKWNSGWFHDDLYTSRLEAKRRHGSM